MPEDLVRGIVCACGAILRTLEDDLTNSLRAGVEDCTPAQADMQIPEWMVVVAGEIYPASLV